MSDHPPRARFPVAAQQGTLGGSTDADRAAAFHRTRPWLTQAESLICPGVWSWDPCASAFVLSEEACRLLGVEPIGAAGCCDLAASLVHMEDAARISACVQQALAVRCGFDVVVRVCVASGETRWVNMSAQVASGPDGAVAGLYGTLLDVTRLIEAEAVLRDSELRLRVLHAINEVARELSEPESILSQSLRVLGQHLRVTRCAFAILDADGDTYTIPADYAVDCPSMAGRYSLRTFGEYVANELTTGKTLVLRDTHELPESASQAFDLLQIRASVCCSLLRQGELRAMMAVHHCAPRDWTAAEVALVEEVVERCWSAIEQSSAELRLRENEALLRMAGHVARLGAFQVELTPSERWTLSDEARATLEAREGVALTHEHLSRLVSAQTLDLCKEKWVHDLAFDIEVPIVTFEQRARWVRCVGRIERDPSGKPLRVQGALQDVDERHKLEEQLHQAQRMEAIGQLAGGVAHDFNNVLSVILSYADLIAAEVVNDVVAEDIEEVRRAALRASELTQQLLAFSCRQVRQPRPFDLNESVRDMEKLLHRVLGDDISFVLDLAATSVGVFADPGQVEQVILNLVLNARDAMPDGGTVTIDTTRVDLDEEQSAPCGIEPGAYGLLRVTDTGTGMSDATRARIFEPFFTTKEKSKGTGLGLSTLHGIVVQSGGHVAVSSELGRGSQFQIYLPLTDQPFETEVTSVTDPLSLCGGETVLVVDDDEQVRSLVCCILRRHGYDVIDAQNGGEAFLVCEQTSRAIHLLLTDVVMPRVSGRDLGRRLTSMMPAMRVLYMSGYAEDSIVHRGVIDSDVAFLPKPITPAALLRSVREALDAAPPPCDKPSGHYRVDAPRVADHSVGSHEPDEARRKA